jgi:uncharacterized tellurite resistance protein B-like protein
VDRAKLELLRLPDEKELLESLSRSVNLPVLCRLAKENPPPQYFREYYYNLKANTLPIMGGINRQLENIFTEARNKLGLLSEPIELFVTSDDSFNCHLETANNKVLPGILCLSHSFAQTLNEKEMAFVLGHELGHLIFEHGEIEEALSLLYPRQESMPRHIKRQYKYLRQLQEFSADRVGLISSGDLEASLKMLLIGASGLPENLLNPDLPSILDYSQKLVSDMKEMNVQPELSHPGTPIRMLALKAFADSELYNQVPEGKLDESEGQAVRDLALEEKMSELINLIRIYPSDTQEYWLMIGEAAAIWMIITADKAVSPQEREGLLDVISGFCSCPEAVAREISEKGAETFLEVAVNYFKLNEPSKLDAMVGGIAFFIVRDKRIEDKELETFLEIMEKYFGMEKSNAILAIVAALRVISRETWAGG